MGQLSSAESSANAALYAEKSEGNRKAGQSIESLLRETRGNTTLIVDFLKTSGTAASEESVREIRTCTEKLRDSVELLERMLGAPPHAWAGDVAQQPASDYAPALAPAPVDTATGLPALAAAEAALRLGCGKPGLFAGVFYVQRMPHIHSRFGPTIGNEVLLLSSRHLTDRMLRGDDRIFRWHGPAFVTVISREHSLQQVRAEARRFLAVPLNRLFESDRHSTYLSISLSGEVFPLADASYPEALEKVTSFLAQSPDGRG